MADPTTEPRDWRALREQAGLGLREAARAAHINPAYLSMIERGRMIATPDESWRLLVALRVGLAPAEEEVIAT